MSNLKKIPGITLSGTTRDWEVTAYWFVKIVSFDGRKGLSGLYVIEDFEENREPVDRV